MSDSTTANDRPALTDVDRERLRRAELMIGKWDQEGGMTYRELSSSLYDVYRGFCKVDDE